MIVHKTIEARTIDQLERELKKFPHLKLVSFSLNEGVYRASLADTYTEEVEED